MAMYSPTYLALKVNALLDGQKFYDHWREKFRNPQSYGTAIKSLCPFHLGESFRTFLLDLQKKTFRCTITQCKAAPGGTFVDLHALLADKSFPEALLDFCSTFKIALPDDVGGLLAVTLAEQGRKLLGEGRLEAAESLAISGIKRDPTSAVLQILLAEICELRARPGDARPYYESVLREAIARKHWNQAAEVLDRLRALEPNQSTYTEQAAAIAEARGDRDKAIVCYLELGSQPNVSPNERRSWLEKARSIDPSHPEVLESLGALAEQTNQIAEALTIWKSLAERYRQDGQCWQSLTVLDRIAKLQPEMALEIEEQRADLLFAANCRDEAAKLLKSLANRALEQSAVDQAERYLRRLAELFPNDIEAHWLLLILFEQTDREDNAALVADYLLAIGDAQTLGERYLEILRRLRRWRPNNTFYRERLAMYCASHGDVETALSEMKELVEKSLQRGATAEALQRIQTLCAIVANQPRLRLEIAQFLVAHGCSQEAVNEYESIARQCAIEAPALAEEACLRGLEIASSRPVLREVLFQISLADRPDRALEQCRWLVEFHRTRGDAKKALAVLEQLCGRLPQEVEVRLTLASLLVEAGQPERALAALEEIGALGTTAEQTVEAIKIANALVPQFKDPPELLKLQASLYRRQGDQETLITTLLRLAAAQERIGSLGEAEASYSEILTLRPNEAEALRACAELERRERGFDAAKLHYQRYVEQLLSSGQDEEAARFYQQCTEWAPDDAELRRGLASVLAKQGNLEGARAQWEIAAAIYLTAHNNLSMAAECYEAIRVHYPDDLVLFRNLAGLYVLLGDPAKAEQVLGRMDESLPDPSRANHELLFRANLTLNKKTEAFQHAKVLCELYESQGQSDKALALARTMVEMQPKEPAAYERLGDILKKHNAVDELCRMLETLAELQAQAGDAEKAAETLDRYLAIRPDSTAVRKRYTDLVAKEGRGGRWAEKWEALIEAALAAGDSDEADRLFQQALEAEPANLNLHERWVRFLYEQKRDGEGHQALIVLSDRLFESGATKRAAQLLSQTLKEYPKAAELHARLGDLYLAMNEKGHAILSSKTAASLFTERGDLAVAEAVVEKILSLDPQDTSIRSSLIDWLLAAGETDRGLDHARALAAQYAERNLFDLAEHEYRRIVSYDPTDLTSWQKLLEMVEHMAAQKEHISEYLLVAEMLTQRGLVEEAVRLYRRAMQWAPENVEIRQAVIEAYAQIGRDREVISDYLQLAEILAKRGDIEEAVRLYQRVLALEPKNPAAAGQMKRLKPDLSRRARAGTKTQSTLFPIGISGDEQALREAVENCRRILQSKPDNPMIRARMGDLLFQLGQVQEAVREWEQASTDLLRIGEYEPVIRLCEKILQIEPGRVEVQDRLSRARLKKASVTEIESVIKSLEDHT